MGRARGAQRGLSLSQGIASASEQACALSNLCKRKGGRADQQSPKTPQTLMDNRKTGLRCRFVWLASSSLVPTDHCSWSLMFRFGCPFRFPSQLQYRQNLQKTFHLVLLTHHILIVIKQNHFCSNVLHKLPTWTPYTTVSSETAAALTCACR